MDPIASSGAGRAVKRETVRATPDCHENRIVCKPFKWTRGDGDASLSFFM
jgi:hypothetical protein